jgi:glutaredoxin
MGRCDGMKVTLYTAPVCPFCLIVANFLRRNSVKFTEIDISKDPKKKSEMERKSGQSQVPVTDAGGKIIVGYDLKRLKEALDIK